MSKTLVTAKNFVVSHKTAILVVTATVATAAVAITIQQIGLKQHNDFLKENGLYDAFYAMNEND